MAAAWITPATRRADLSPLWESILRRPAQIPHFWVILRCWSHESAAVPADFRSPDRTRHRCDGNNLADRFVVRWHRKYPAPDCPRLGQNAARGGLHPRTRGGVGKTRSPCQLRLRLQSREPPGYFGGAFTASLSVPLLRQERTVFRPVPRLASEAGGAPSGGPVQCPQFSQEHERWGPHHH